MASLIENAEEGLERNMDKGTDWDISALLVSKKPYTIRQNPLRLKKDFLMGHHKVIPFLTFFERRR